MLDYERVKSLIIFINILLLRKQTIIQIVKGVSRRRLSNFGGTWVVLWLLFYIGSVANKNNGVIFRIIVMIYMIFVLEILSMWNRRRLTTMMNEAKARITVESRTSAAAQSLAGVLGHN